MDVPRLPAGPIGVIAGTGTVALLAFVAATTVLAARRRWRDVAWAALAVALAGGTIAAHGSVGWHVVLSALTLAAALRNAICFDGAARWLSAAGTAAWIVSSVAARLVFH